MKRSRILENKPVYLALSIFEINKIIIYNFGMTTGNKNTRAKLN